MSAVDIKNEIARLTASINQHKNNVSNTGYSAPSYPPAGRGRGGYRGHSNYPHHGYSNTARRNNKYVRPGLESAATSNTVSVPADSSTPTNSSSTTVAPFSSAFTFSSGTTAPAEPSTSTAIPSGGKKEVLIGGVAFESSARSLVRKDLTKPKPSTTTLAPVPYPYTRKAGHLVSSSRTYKPKGRRGRGRGHNMTLDNTRKSWSERVEMKKRKYLNKPCPRFTTTGTCNRGLTCMYQHDPSKIAICWNFLQGNCTSTAETCNLSHDPTPERTPLCVHFLNKGRCTRVGCLFPHVNVGKREGVCRDFAVLGYCEKGYDCDKQHVRECPDFAENGTCSTKGCKLPHVIRANRGRKAPVPPSATAHATGDASSGLPPGVVTDLGPSTAEEVAQIFAEDGHMGDEFISLTFHESDSDEESEEEEEEDDEENDDGDEEGNEASEDTSETT